MARVSNTYNYEEYGASFELIPEGVHKMVITNAFQKTGEKGMQWELNLQPVDDNYKMKHDLKKWINEDGCIEALFDAMGYDPRTADQNRDYQPQTFIGQVVHVEIYHKKNQGDNRDMTFANVKRLYPQFNMSQFQQGQSQQTTEQYQNQVYGQPNQANQQHQQPQGQMQQGGYLPADPNDAIPF